MASCESCGKPVADDAPSCGACGVARGARVLRPAFGTTGGSPRPSSARGPAPVVRIPLAPKRHVEGPARAWGPGGGRGARVVATPQGGEALAPRTAAFQDVAPDTGTHPIVSPRRREAPPRDPTEPPPTERKDPSSSTTTLRRAAVAAPVLASAALREDLKPRLPGSRTVRIAAVSLGVVGALATLLLAGLGLAPLLCAASLAACAAVGLAPMRYRSRAVALLVASGAGLVVASVAASATGAVPLAPLLAVTAPALAGGLFFRSAYRASRTARVIVAGGIALGVLWLATGGAVTAVGDVLAGGEPTLAKLLGAWVVVPLVLALLAFMGPDSTAAGRVTGGMVLGWLALYATGAAVPLAWPVAPVSLARAGVVAVAFPQLATLAALAFAQVLVCARGGGVEKAAPPA